MSGLPADFRAFVSGHDLDENELMRELKTQVTMLRALLVEGQDLSMGNNRRIAQARRLFDWGKRVCAALESMS